MFKNKLTTGLITLALLIITWNVAIFLVYNGLGLSKLEKSDYINKEFEGIIIDMKPKTILTTNAEKHNRIGNNIIGTEITLFDGKKIFVSNGMIAYKVVNGQSKLSAYSYSIIEQPNKKNPPKKYDEFVIHVSHKEELEMKIRVFICGGGITLGYLK